MAVYLRAVYLVEVCADGFGGLESSLVGVKSGQNLHEKRRNTNAADATVSSSWSNQDGAGAPFNATKATSRPDVRLGGDGADPRGSSAGGSESSRGAGEGHTMMKGKVVASRRYPSVERRFRKALEKRATQAEADVNKDAVQDARDALSVSKMPGDECIAAAVMKLASGSYSSKVPQPGFTSLAGTKPDGDPFVLWPVVVRQMNAFKRRQQRNQGQEKEARPQHKQKPKQQFDADKNQNRPEGGNKSDNLEKNGQPFMSLTYSSLFAVAVVVPDLANAPISMLCGNSSHSLKASNSFSMPCVSGATQFLDDLQKALSVQNSGVLLKWRVEWFLSRAAPLGTPIETDDLALRCIQRRSNVKAFEESPGIRYPSWKPCPGDAASQQYLNDAQRYLSEQQRLLLLSRHSLFESSSTQDELDAAATDAAIGGDLDFSFNYARIRLVSDARQRGLASTAAWGLQPKVYPRGAVPQAQISFRLSERVTGVFKQQNSCNGDEPFSQWSSEAGDEHLDQSDDCMLIESLGWQIDGVIECVSRLEGAAEITLTLSGLDDIVDRNLNLIVNDAGLAAQVAVQFFYHGCVRGSSSNGPAPSGGRITFCPPLGHFDLVQYRVFVPSATRLGKFNEALEERARSLAAASAVSSALSLSSAQSPQPWARTERGGNNSAASPGMNGSLNLSLESDTVSIASNASALTAGLSVEDRGNYQARTIRRLYHDSRKTKQHWRGEHDLGTIPKLPITGSFFVSPAGVTNNPNMQSGDISHSLKMILKLEIQLPEQAFKMQGETPVAVELLAPGSARITSHSLGPTLGDVSIHPSQKHLVWKFKLGCLLSQPQLRFDDTAHNQENVMRRTAIIAGTLCIEPGACTERPHSGPVLFADKNCSAPLSLPLRETNVLEAHLLFAVKGPTASGIKMDSTSVQVAPPSAMIQHQRPISVETFVVSERIVLQPQLIHPA